MNKTRSLLLLAPAGGALAFATIARADSTLVINRQITPNKHSVQRTWGERANDHHVRSKPYTIP
jgi:hypothetical protein